MNKVNVFDVEGTEYPAGRKTRVILGDNGAICGDHFCQGYVVIYPGGSIPAHDHPTEETYTILKGCGKMTVGNESCDMHEGDFVHIRPYETHSLVNTGDKDMHMMFVYAPRVIVDHWAQELSGELK